MKKLLLIIIILFLLLLSFCSEKYENEKEKIKPVGNPNKVASFPVIGKLWQFFINKGYIFIKDNQNIHCYDLNTFKFVKNLIKKGEGPGEFVRVPSISFSKNKYILQSMNKIIFLDNSFEFINEMRTSSLSIGALVSLENNFITEKYIPEDKSIDYILADKKFKKTKTITSESHHSGTSYFNIFLKTRVWDNKLFIAKPAKGLFFDVFDKNGNYIYNINKKIRTIKTAKNHELRRNKEYLHRMGKRMFKRWKAGETRLIPKYLPDINDYWLDNNRIYVKTYDLNNNLEKYIILNFKGKIIKIVFLPTTFIGTSAFHNNKFYYLKDNGKKETWDLYSIQL